MKEKIEEFVEVLKHTSTANQRLGVVRGWLGSDCVVLRVVVRKGRDLSSNNHLAVTSPLQTTARSCWYCVNTKQQNKTKQNFFFSHCPPVVTFPADLLLPKKVHPISYSFSLTITVYSTSRKAISICVGNNLARLNLTLQAVASFWPSRQRADAW